MRACFLEAILRPHYSRTGSPAPGETCVIRAFVRENGKRTQRKRLSGKALRRFCVGNHPWPPQFPSRNNVMAGRRGTRPTPTGWVTAPGPQVGDFVRYRLSMLRSPPHFTLTKREIGTSQQNKKQIKKKGQGGKWLKGREGRKMNSTCRSCPIETGQEIAPSEELTRHLAQGRGGKGIISLL